MPMKFLLWFGVLVSVCGFAEAQRLDEAEFAKLHGQLEPKDEAWKAVPWKTDLLQAQGLAAQSKKPMFIWAMDGHPLGCT